MRYEQIWNAVDKLAKINGLSPSGLAKKAGLDSTTFNKSKRIRPDGKKRFPSLESINKIIAVCNITFDQFYKLAEKEIGEEDTNSIPYIKFSSLEKMQDVKLEVEINKWNKIKFPDNKHNLYAVELDSKSNSSNYPAGTILIVSQNSEVRRGDKVIVLYNDANIYIGEFIRRTATTIEISHQENEKDITLTINNINFINRILWVSQ